MKLYFKAHVERSIGLLKKYFMDIFIEQKALEQLKGKVIVEKILENRSSKLKERVVAKWDKANDKSTLNLFNLLTEEVELYELVQTDDEYPLTVVPKPRKIKRLTFIEEEIMLAFLYPRMDYNVSTMQNHLLKLPFSVHPSSNKISVPFFK